MEFLRGPLPSYLFLPEPRWEALCGKLKGPCRQLGRHHDFYKGYDVVLVTNE